MAVRGIRGARTSSAVAVAVLLGLVFAAPVRAAESLDPSFGEGGIAFPGLVEGDVKVLAEDPEGRLVSGGRMVLDNLLVARFARQGALDLSFGGDDGYVTTDVGFGGRANAVAVQRDGKILAAGSTEAGVFVLVRYGEDGRQDLGFGKRGRATTITGPNGGGAQDLDLQPNGRILAAGYGIDAHHRWEARVTAYRPNGFPDRSFSSDGIASLRTKGTRPIELVAVEAQPNGRIIAAGDLNGQIMVVALRANGKPDRRFGDGDGIVLTDVDGGRHCACAYATDMEIDRRRRIVVSANVTTPRKREPSVLLRYRPNGKLDRSFGNEGIARASLGSRLAGKDIAIQHDGRIVQAGTYNVPKSGEARVAVSRFLPDGKLDRGFARRGFFTRDFGYESVAYAALTQRDGRVVIGGRANSGPSPFREDPSIYDTAEVFLIRFLS